jgi:hypothetical protein
MIMSNCYPQIVLADSGRAENKMARIDPGRLLLLAQADLPATPDQTYPLKTS